MLDDLLENMIIELHEPKQLEEAERTNDSQYYHYHMIIGHPLEKYIPLKECIMQLAKDGRIILNLDDTAEANCICAQLESLPSWWENYI